MIKLMLCLLCAQSILFAVNKKDLANHLNDLKSNNKELFTQEEENTLSKSINMLNNDASIWQLMGMRYALREVLNNKINGSPDIKCTCGESEMSYHKFLEKVNAEIQTILNHFVAEEQKQLRKKVGSCAKITAFTSAGFLLTYGITLFIRAINEEA